MLKHVRASESWTDKNIGQKGFTLIELLIVIIILGVLAGIVVLAVGGLKNTGDKNACKTEKKTVESAAAAFYSDNNNTWPSSSTSLTTYLDDAALKYKPWGISTTTGKVTTGTGTPTGC